MIGFNPRFTHVVPRCFYVSCVGEVFTAEVCRGLFVTLSLRFRSRTEAGRLLSCLASLTNFDLTENDIKELPKLTFSGKIGVINNSVDEDIHCNEIKEIQNAGSVSLLAYCHSQTPPSFLAVEPSACSHTFSEMSCWPGRCCAGRVGVGMQLQLVSAA